MHAVTPVDMSQMKNKSLSPLKLGQASIFLWYSCEPTEYQQCLQLEERQGEFQRKSFGDISCFPSVYNEYVVQLGLTMP